MPHESATRQRFGWFIAALCSGLLLLLATRAYYVFVFLPHHHDSFAGAAAHLIDFSGWLAFVRSPPGAALHLAAAACFIAAAAITCFGSARRAA